MPSKTITWTPIFPDVDHATGVNPAGGPKQNVNLLRVDLSRPYVSFFLTPKDALEKCGVKTTDFLAKHFDPKRMAAMLAVNANFFDMGDRRTVFGLAISQGQVVSPFDPQHPFEIRISRNNLAAIVKATSAGPEPDPWTAASGNVQLVAAGKVVTNPAVPPLVAARTAVGLSKPSDGRPHYLYLITIDGLEEGSSNSGLYYGATFVDTAEWLIAAGADTAFNFDGGGSTTMAKISGTTNPKPVLMNEPHDDEHSKTVIERLVAASFAVVVGNNR
jgi:hypothetical protein